MRTTGDKPCLDKPGSRTSADLRSRVEPWYPFGPPLPSAPAPVPPLIGPLPVAIGKCPELCLQQSNQRSWSGLFSNLPKRKVMKSSTYSSSIPTHAVRARRYYYGAEDRISIDMTGSLRECREHVFGKEASTYYASHNEASRVSLKVVTFASLRPNARDEALRLDNR